MKKIYIFLLVFATAWLSEAKAQQDPQFSQNMFNRLSINPGYAGSNGAICGTLLGRQQWTGFDGAPKTVLLSVDAPIKILHGGLGLSIASDQLGFDKSFYGKFAYAFRIAVGETGNFAIGAEAGVLNKSLSGTWKAVDPVASDPTIPASVSDLAMDVGLGLYYNTPDLYIGISSTHLNAANLKDTKFELARHYYLHGGYSFNLTPQLALKPSLYIKTDGSSTQFDFNAYALYNNTLWGGVSYRLTDAIVPMIGFQKTFSANSTLKIGYSYDVTTSAIKNHSSGSHEIMLGYCLGLSKKTIITKQKNVRFL